MKDTRTRQRLKRILSIVILSISVFSISYLIIKQIEANKQGSIQITSWDAIQAFKDTGYQVINIAEYEEADAGPLGFLGYNIRFDIQTEDMIYELRIIQYDNWETAYRLAKRTNTQDKKWDGTYLFAFSFGQIYINLWPSDEEFGKELLSVLEANMESKTK